MVSVWFNTPALAAGTVHHILRDQGDDTVCGGAIQGMHIAVAIAGGVRIIGVLY